MAQEFDFRNKITQLTQADLKNADNANRPHNELQENIFWLYENMLSSLGGDTVSGVRELHVNWETGNDGNPGTIEQPFKHISRAFEELTKIAVGQIKIVVQGSDSFIYEEENEIITSNLGQIKTGSAEQGVILTTLGDDPVTVSGSQGNLDTFINLTGGNLVVRGKWEFEGFNSSPVKVNGAEILFDETEIDFDDNTTGAKYPCIDIRDNSVSYFNECSVTFSGDVTTFISIIDNSNLIAEGCDLPSIYVARNGCAVISGTDDSGSITGYHDSSGHYTIPVSTDGGYVKIFGTQERDLPIDYEDSTYQKPRIQIYGAELDTAYISTTAFSSDIAPIKILHSSSLRMPEQNSISVNPMSGYSGEYLVAKIGCSSWRGRYPSLGWEYEDRELVDFFNVIDDGTVTPIFEDGGCGGSGASIPIFATDFNGYQYFGPWSGWKKICSVNIEVSDSSNNLICWVGGWIYDQGNNDPKAEYFVRNATDSIDSEHLKSGITGDEGDDRKDAMPTPGTFVLNVNSKGTKTVEFWMRAGRLGKDDRGRHHRLTVMLAN